VTIARDSAPRPFLPTLAREWLTALADLVFPPFCPVCRARLGEGRRDPLCGACWARLERIRPPVCRVCGLPLGALPGSALDGRRCGPCRLHPPAFAYARAAAEYGETVRRAIHAFKFGGRRALATPLGDLLAGVDLADVAAPGPDLLVPVPLYPSRQRQRGFNQAELLAARLGRLSGLSVDRRALRRRRGTAVQADLPARERAANVRGAFVVGRPERVAGRDVLLVDDVMTTGATAGSCAAALLDAGAATVGVLTVARVS
jgi:ComF family protein